MDAQESPRTVSGNLTLLHTPTLQSAVPQKRDVPSSHLKIHQIPPNETHMHEPCPPFMTWHTSCLILWSNSDNFPQGAGKDRTRKNKYQRSTTGGQRGCYVHFSNRVSSQKSQTRWVCGAARVAVMEPGNPGHVRTATILADTTRPNSFSTPSFYRVEFVSGDIKSYGESVFYDRSGGRGLHFDCDGRTRHLHAAEQILDPTTLNGLSVTEFPVSFVRDPPT